MKTFNKMWFILAFFITMLFPLYGGILERNITLSGVAAAPEEVVASQDTLGNGAYQTYLNDLWESSFSGKKILLKVRNQLLYSICNISPNKNVVIGKEGYLYEPAYILYENQTYAPGTEEYFHTLGNNLHKLKTLLEQNGKELYIFITPSKAYFYGEYIPNSYMSLSQKGNYEYTNYEKLLEILDEKGLNYYDSINYIENNLNSDIIQSPLYYKSGIHWSHIWGESAAREFLNYMKSNSRYDLSTVEVSEGLSDVPIYPDTDLYDSLNLLADADEKWYSSQMSILEEGSDHPSVFLRGGSFLGQSLNALVRTGVFGEDVHFENNYYFKNQYSETYNLSAFDAYEEINLDTLVGKSDILILEVNEAAISNMSWGFIEELLEHPEYLDYNY